VTVELARLLLASGAVPRPAVQSALATSLHQRIPFVTALLDQGAIDDATLAREVTHANMPALRSVSPIPELVARLPAHLCRRTLAVPVRFDAVTGTVDVAVANPLDPHVQAEFAFHLEAPVRLVRAPYAALREAARSVDPEEDPFDRHTSPLASTIASLRATPAFGTPIVSAAELPIPLVRRSISPRSASSHAPADLGDTSEIARFDPASIASRPPPPEHHAVTALRAAATRDDVIAVLLSSMSELAPRTGVLVHRRNAYVGWICTEAMGDAEAFRRISISTLVPSALTAVANKGWFLGHIPPVPPHEPLLEILGATSLEVCIVAVEVADRPVMLLLCTDLNDTMSATRLADLLAREAGRALARILSSEKRSR